MTDLVAIGEIAACIIQTGRDERGAPIFTARPGGAPARVAAAAARLGAKTAFIGKVGNDPRGEELREELARSGVDTSGLLAGGGNTSLFLRSLSPAGRPLFQVFRGADRDLSPDEVREPQVERARILHFGSGSLVEGLCRPATIFAARQARQADVLVSYAPGYRAAMWDNEDHAAEWMRIPLPLVNLIDLSQAELPLLAGTAEPETGSERLARMGPALVLVELDGEKIFYRWRGHTGQVPGFPAEEEARAVFQGAVLSRVARREKRDLLDGLTPDGLEEILLFAAREAAHFDTWLFRGDG